MSLTIHTMGKMHPRSSAAYIAANYNKVKLETDTLDLSKGAHKDSKFTCRFPCGRIPSLTLADGTCIDQSTAVLRAVVRAGHDVGLYGTNTSEMAQVDMWLDFAAQDLYLNMAPWFYPLFGFAKFDHDATEAAKVKVANNLAVLNKHLESRTFVVGERITAADILLAVYCHVGFSAIFDADYRKPFPNVVRWYETVAHQPEFVDVRPWAPLCDKMQVAGETKAEAPKAAESTDAASAEPVKSSFVLDEFKRKYSNADDTRSIMSWLWENFDSKAFSFWKSEHKFPQDNEKMLQTVNLIGGWFQRLERLHKSSFGSVLIFGEEPKLEVSGIWIMPGDEVAGPMKECIDFEQHDFVKIDHVAEKELIEDYFCWEGKFGGRKYTDNAKIFK